MLSLFLWHGVTMPQNFEDAMRWVTLAAVSGERKALSARNAMLDNITVNVNGGLATSAEIGQAVVDSIRAYNRSAGPARIEVSGYV